jgi:polysaccharide biosynthesis protein PslG
MRRASQSLFGRAGVLTLALAVLVVAVGLLLYRNANEDPFAASAITDPPFTSLTYSIQAFLWWDSTESAERLDMIQRMLFSHVKQTFAWKNIEPIPGEWHFSQGDLLLGEAERRGIQVVARLSDSPDWAYPSLHGVTGFVDAPPDNVADFAHFCGQVASRYPGRIAAYQIWNEPNLSREWGGKTPNAADYVALLKACSEAIRAADPQAIIISAGLAPTGNYDAGAHPDTIFLQAMYDAGFQQYVDVVGAHAAGYSSPEIGPDEAEAAGGQRFFTFRRVEDLRLIMVANGDAARQMAILEMGWTRDEIHDDYRWYAVSEEQQARNLVAAYQYAADHWRPWIGLMSTIYIADPMWTENDEEYWWSIVDPVGIQRLAYVELANMAKYCGDRIIPARAPDSPEALGLVHVEPCE